MKDAVYQLADELLRFVVLLEMQPELFVDGTPFRAGLANTKLRLAIALGYPPVQAEHALGGVIAMPTEPSEIETAMTDLALQVKKWRGFYADACDRADELREAERLRRINGKRR